MTVKEKKAKIGWSTTPASCQNCTNFSFDEVEKKYHWQDEMIKVQSNFRCDKHGFATKKMAWCIDHSM